MASDDAPLQDSVSCNTEQKEAEQEAPQSLLHICRFCLSRDEEDLIPLENVLLLTLTIEDILLFTGIQIEEEDYGEIALCVKCTNKIQICSYFRHCCLTNDTTFRELCADLIAKVKAARIEAKEAAAAAEQALREAEEAALEVEAANQHCDTIELSSDDEFNYSANYIKPGEVLHIEEPMYRPSDWDMSLNPTPPAVQCHPREKGKRKLHLCDLCGLKVGHIPTHYLDHSTVATVGCPYCPVKMKAQKSINEHIHTVHFKLVSKTCEICGKGFVHHKTYRYHMITHQDEGNTFECKDCSKTFTNSIYLRDHIKRVHNAAKKVKPKDSEETVKKKRIRSRNSEDNRIYPDSD